jgi:diacylglycerol kinase family enzyme
MRYTTIAIIYNPNSTGSSEALAQEFAAQVRTQLPKQKVQLIGTEHAGHGEALSYELAKKSKHPLIISSSGDGGYNDVINGVMRAKREGFKAVTGLLPAGNANDHYTNLHTEGLIEQIVNGTSMNIDLLKISGVTDGKKFQHYAHSYIGLGFTPFIARELNKKKLNPINEFFIVLGSLMKIKPIYLKIGRKPSYYESVIFSNVDVMSKYLKISQPSSMTDGKFEVTIFKRRNKIRLISLLLRASLRGVKEDTQVKKFSLKTMQKTLVQADGEILTVDANSKVRITAERQALACIV